MSPPSDEELRLIKACIAGDQRSPRVLYERYAGSVASIIWKFVHDRETVEDLMQETFLRVFKGLHRFRADASFKTWVTRIAINLCSDYYNSEVVRRQRTKHISIDGEEGEGIPELPDTAPDGSPEETLKGRQLEKRMMAEIEKLPSDQKTAMILHLQGYSYEEIAEIMKLPKGTVGRLIHEARCVLRPLLEYLKHRKRV